MGHHHYNSRLAFAVRAMRPFMPPLNFITVHYAYFIVVPLVASVVFWGSSNPRFSISYVDSLFLVVSAMTEAGLNTVNLSQMTTWQQVMLWLLIIMGSSIWVSIWTILVRKHAFERRFQEIVQRENQRRLEGRSTLPLVDPFPTLAKSQGHPVGSRRGFASEPVFCPATRGDPGGVSPTSNRVSVTKVENTGSGSNGADEGLPSQSQNSGALARADHIVFVEDPRRKALSTSVANETVPTRRNVPDSIQGEHTSAAAATRWDSYVPSSKVGRNAQFHDLTREERESLGGTEYRALQLLSLLVPVYWFSWQFLGSISLGAWIARYQPGPARENAIDPWWNGIFNGVSAFNNSGMTVLDANMVPYGASYFVLIVMGAMILAGNTAYPIFLRLIIWTGLKVLHKVSAPDQLVAWKTTLEYILKYPRRVYTNLFPARQTWWLLFMLFLLNGTDWIGYEVLNFGNPALEQTPLGPRIIDGLFQALAVRSGGFYVVPIPTLYIGLQVLYVIMMYVSVYPVVITMRHSNVYEERSLGIYDDYEEEDGQGPATSSPLSRHASNRSAASRQVGSTLRRTLTAAWNGVGAARHGHGHGRGHHHQERRIDFVSHQVRSQLSHDLWWLVLAVLAIVVIETRHFLEDPVHWSVFNVVFEVVSAYGCVGITPGVPGAAYSFSGAWYPGSKLLLCLVMLRGRHRGLPVALDRAVRLPGDDLHDEDEDHRIRRSLSVSARRPSVDGSHV